MDDIQKSSIRISYIIGLPFGTALIAGVYLMFSFADKSTGSFVLETMGFSIAALYISFIFSLWIAGKIAANSVLNGSSLIGVSLRYCLAVNGVIWFSFVLVQIISDFGLTIFLRVPIIGFIVSLPLSIITIGLLISKFIKSKIEKIQSFESTT